MQIGRAAYFEFHGDELGEKCLREFLGFFKIVFF